MFKVEGKVIFEILRDYAKLLEEMDNEYGQSRDILELENDNEMCDAYYILKKIIRLKYTKQGQSNKIH